MQVFEITKALESLAPLQYQEPYDNAGLNIGDPTMTVTSALLTLDVTEAVIDEAIALGCNLIVAHHPVIFNGIKSLNGKSYTERCIIKAIQHHIAIYCSHTNLDAVQEGVNMKICEKLQLENIKQLEPTKGQLCKLVTFVPETHLESVRHAVCDAGAGHIGNYDVCSFTTAGSGTFRGGDNTKPFVGEKGKLHTEKEIRFETIFPAYLENDIIKSLEKAHPYEEVAYDIYKLENSNSNIGIGMTGELKTPEDALDFLKRVKDIFSAKCIRHTALKQKKIKKIAVCGGSGSSLLKHAISEGADMYISADFKYHQFFDADGKIIIADIGHFESEQFTKEIFYDLLIKKFPNFAVHFSRINTNPINYL